MTTKMEKKMIGAFYRLSEESLQWKKEKAELEKRNQELHEMFEASEKYRHEASLDMQKRDEQISYLQERWQGQSATILEQMTQIAALKELVTEERAIWIYETSPEGGALVHMSRPKEIGECWKKDARQQLEAEHPEAMT